MLTAEMTNILSSSREAGWVLEPNAKRLFSLAGLETPRFIWAAEPGEATCFAKKIGYPVVAKIVSPKVIHKSDRHGVAVGIDNDETLVETFNRFQRIEGFSGMLVEEMLSGLELIVGAKRDYHFGPVILLGVGGTGVEIYRDVSLKMAPLRPQDVPSMINCLKGRQLFAGYRGSEPVNVEELTRLLATFSELVMDLEKHMESIDLNPVICSSDKCIIADARIMLKN